MTDSKVARDRADMPTGTGAILDRRSLADSHRQLASLLRPGMRVLDVGCGTAAITADVADSVGTDGMAVGTDINHALVAQGKERQRSRRHFSLAVADIFALPFGPVFDIVTAARVLQWLAQPGEAVTALSRTVKPGGVLLVLDYDHEAIVWTPSPPLSMQRFYAAFLSWRSSAGFDNAVAKRLPGLFEAVGASDVTLSPQHERTHRDDDDFVKRAGIWADVAATRGHQMVRDGLISEPQRAAAEREYRAWVSTDAVSMAMHLVAVHGTINDTSQH